MEKRLQTLNPACFPGLQPFSPSSPFRFPQAYLLPADCRLPLRQAPCLNLSDTVAINNLAQYRRILPSRAQTTPVLSLGLLLLLLLLIAAVLPHRASCIDRSSHLNTSTPFHGSTITRYSYVLDTAFSTCHRPPSPAALPHKVQHRDSYLWQLSHTGRLTCPLRPSRCCCCCCPRPMKIHAADIHKLDLRSFSLR